MADLSGPRIEITVDRTGTTSTAVFEIEGAACQTVSAGYEAVLGEVISTEATAEAYEDEHEVEIRAETGG